MPVSIKKVPGKNCYRVSTPHGVKAKCTSKTNADRQKRLLNGVEHGFVPTGESKAEKLVNSLLEVGQGSHPTMTVGELIAELQQFPHGTPVYYGHASGDYWKTEIAGAIKIAALKGVEHSDYHQKMRVKAENPDMEPRDEGDGGHDEVVVLGSR
jgi:hypothetical protein